MRVCRLFEKVKHDTLPNNFTRKKLVEIALTRLIQRRVSFTSAWAAFNSKYRRQEQGPAAVALWHRRKDLNLQNTESKSVSSTNSLTPVCCRPVSGKWCSSCELNTEPPDYKSSALTCWARGANICSPIHRELSENIRFQVLYTENLLVLRKGFEPLSLPWEGNHLAD